MPLLLPYDASGLDGKLRTVIDDIIGRIQIWAGKQEGINAAERLNEISTGIASLPTVKTGFGQVHFGATLPTGYLWCDGAAVSRTTYANLFAEIGTTYGSGDGTSTFNVPDMRRRMPLGKAASGSASTLGSTGGAFDHTHSGGTVSGLTALGGAHTHSVTGSTGDASPDTDSSTLFFGNFATTVDANLDGTTKSVVNANGTSSTHDHTVDAHAHSAGTLAAASDGAHQHGAGTLAVGTSGSANPPYLVCNWIIKA